MSQPAVIRCASCGEDFAPASGSRPVCPRCLLLGGAAILDDVEASPAEPPPGTIIGNYTLKARLGEGGFGLVYLAMQDAPVQREVALKVVKAGMDSTEVLRRFEAERQTLAMLDHPNVATLFDAGTTPEGRPYFVMERVDGEPVTIYCDRRNLDLPKRLEVFIGICRAVQHAHQKGILHRDIKPANVLVSEHDGKPLPKVIDFGVAKALDPRLDDLQQRTVEGRYVGTPEYMSPEQVGGARPDTDTRSDVYSLGVLLYELLTGITPLDPGALRRSSPGEMERMIRETEAPKPSDRARDAAVARQLRGDLDWIVLRAIEKDRDRRYASVDALVSDILRHQSHEPVSARPPTTIYQIQKFARRHRGLIGAVAAVAVVLVAGIVATSWQAVRATRAREESDRQRYHAEMNLAGHAAVNAEGNRRVRDLVEPWRDTPFRGWEWHFLNALSEQSEAVIAGHDGFVTGLDWHPGGTRLASAGTDGVVRLWHVESGRELAGLREHAGAVNAVAWDPAGRRIASAGADGTLRIRMPETRDAPLVGSLEGSPPLRVLEWHPDGGRIAVGTTAAVAVFSVAKNQFVNRFELPGGARVDHLGWSPDGHELRSAWTTDRDPVDGLPWKQLRGWNVEKNEEVRVVGFPLGESSFRAMVDRSRADAMAWSPDGERIALAHASIAGRMRRMSAARGGGRSLGGGMGGGRGSSVFSLRLWDLGDESSSDPFGHTVQGIHCLAWSPDGRRIASGGVGHRVSVWTPETGTMNSYRGHQDLVRCIRWSPDGNRLASGAEDGRIRLWDPARPAARRILWTGPGTGQARFRGSAYVAWSPDGRELAAVGPSVSDDLWTWDARSGVVLAGFEDESHSAIAVAWQPDGARIATAGNEGRLKIWDRKSRTEAASFKLPFATPTSVAFAGDGVHVACSGNSGSISIWNVARGEEVHRLEAHEGRVEAIGFSPDGKRLASCGRDTLVRVWNLATGTADLTFTGHADNVFDLAWNPDGTEIASIGLNPILRVWNSATGKERLSIAAHVGPPRSLAWSPDGRMIASCGGGPDRSVKLWNPEDGRELLALGFRDMGIMITQLRWSPDSHALALTNSEGAIMVWDASRSIERN